MGISCFAVPGASLAGHVWEVLVGPALMVLLFIFISIPMMEKRQLKRRGVEYAHYMDSVGMLIPRLF